MEHTLHSLENLPLLMVTSGKIVIALPSEVYNVDHVTGYWTENVTMSVRFASTCGLTPT